MRSAIRLAMLRSAIHLLLAVQLAACPGVCGLVSKMRAAPEQSASAQPPIRAHCCQAPRDDVPIGRKAPAAPVECPCKVTGHNCICSGALVKPIDFELSIAPRLFACLPEPAGPIASDRTATPVDPFHAECPPPCDGRSLRALICSFLC